MKKYILLFAITAIIITFGIYLLLRTNDSRNATPSGDLKLLSKFIHIPEWCQDAEWSTWEVENDWGVYVFIKMNKSTADIVKQSDILAPENNVIYDGPVGIPSWIHGSSMHKFHSCGGGIICSELKQYTATSVLKSPFSGGWVVYFEDNTALVHVWTR